MTPAQQGKAMHHHQPGRSGKKKSKAVETAMLDLPLTLLLQLLLRCTFASKLISEWLQSTPVVWLFAWNCNWGCCRAIRCGFAMAVEAAAATDAASAIFAAATGCMPWVSTLR